MKNLLIPLLDTAYNKLIQQIPKTKRTVRTIPINNISPMELPDFINNNNIPKDCWFHMDDCGVFSSFELELAWYVDIPTTEKDGVDYCRKRFTSVAWSIIYKDMLENGYKRIGVNSAEFKKYKDTTIYDMYMEKDFDRLAQYYSLYFKLI